jgi:hypothetical protein
MTFFDCCAAQRRKRLPAWGFLSDFHETTAVQQKSASETSLFLSRAPIQATQSQIQNTILESIAHLY